MESVDRSGKVFALSVVFLGLMKEGDEGWGSTAISISSSVKMTKERMGNVSGGENGR
jgi:hypothetical protein